MPLRPGSGVRRRFSIPAGGQLRRKESHDGDLGRVRSASPSRVTVTRPRSKAARIYITNSARHQRDVIDSSTNQCEVIRGLEMPPASSCPVEKKRALVLFSNESESIGSCGSRSAKIMKKVAPSGHRTTI